MAKQNKKTRLYIILGTVALVGVVIGVYFLSFYQPDIEGIDDVEALTDIRKQQLKTDFDLETLSDPRLLELRQYGPEQITATGRGEKPNPFEPF